MMTKNDNTTLMITRQRLQEQIQTHQGREALPIPMALASPERSSVDEQSFKVFPIFRLLRVYKNNILPPFISGENCF